MDKSKRESLINAIADGDIQKLENFQQEATGKRYVIHGFTDHLKMPLAYYNNPDVEVVFAPGPYLEFLESLPK